MVFLTDVIVFKKAPFSKFHTKTQSRCFQIPPVGRAFFENLRFRDGLVWTVDLSAEIKPRCQVSPAYCVTGLQVLTC